MQGFDSWSLGKKTVYLQHNPKFQVFKHSKCSLEHLWGFSYSRRKPPERSSDGGITISGLISAQIGQHIDL